VGGPRHAPRRRAGFTLVELLTVIVILGLIGGVAVISWQSILPKQKLNSAVRNLSEVLHSTRSEAISRNHEFQVWYDLDAETYRVRTPYRPGGGYVVRTENDDDIEYVWIHDTNLANDGLEIVSVTIDDIPYYDGKVYVRYDPLGASAYHVIVLYQPIFEKYYTIEVLPLTGDIRTQVGHVVPREPPDENDFR
jgi:prepilin-type N-terminal cleavage/methylation domain-containing protein